MKYLVSLVLLASLQAAVALTNMKLLHEWNELEFTYPDEEARQRAIDNKYYVRGNSLPIDVDVHYSRGAEKTRIFITNPRFDVGRPYSLAVVTKEMAAGGPVVAPYPDYSWHDNQETNCQGMTSVFRVAIDECSRMWVLDAGKIGDRQVCPPQLLAFDLNTDTLLVRHHLDSSTVKPASLYITPVLDIRDPKNGCKDTFVYMADVSGFGLAVYDMASDSSWRVDNKLFFPHPPYGTHTIAGESFELMDGVLGMALSPLRGPQEERRLYFHALASVTENHVSTAILRNQTAWRTLPGPDPRHFEAFKQTRSTQSAAEAMDRSGNLFFGLDTAMAIACWDSSKPFGQKYIEIVAQNPETLQFASGMKVVNNLKGKQELWVMTVRIQKVFTGTISLDEVNFRIQAANIEDLVRGTKCAFPKEGDLTNHVGGANSHSSGFSTYGGVRFP